MELKNWATKLWALSCIFHNDFVKMTNWDYQDVIRACLPHNFYKFHVPTFSTDSFKNLYVHHNYKGQIGYYQTIAGSTVLNNCQAIIGMANNYTLYEKIAHKLWNDNLFDRILWENFKRRLVKVEHPLKEKKDAACMTKDCRIWFFDFRGCLLLIKHKNVLLCFAFATVEASSVGLQVCLPYKICFMMIFD